MVAFTFPIIYYGLVVLFNKTRIRADRDRVIRTVGPWPVFRTVSLPALGLRQFFAISNGGSKSSTYFANTIYAIDDQDHVWTLATALPSSFAAHQICHELEDFYRIEDVPVYGVTTDPSHPGPRPG